MTILKDGITEGAWFDVRRRQSRKEAIGELAGKAVVLLGETHNDPAHHQWQLNTLTALLHLRPDIILGFEMFPRRVQPVLERWFRGELDEAAFLSEVDWPRIWGFDPALYLPLFLFARNNHLSMVALNVDRDTTRRVGAEGFSAVSASDREGVGEPMPASSAYRERLLAWFERHPGATGNAARFERFIGSQLFWDRAMAEAIAGSLSGLRRPLVAAIMGSGHLEYGDGVPHQLRALGVNEVAIALPWPAGTECPDSEPPIADLLFGVAP